MRTYAKPGSAGRNFLSGEFTIERMDGFFPLLMVFIFALLQIVAVASSDAAVSPINGGFSATPDQTATTGDPSPANFTVGAGSDRMLVVVVDTYDSGGTTGITVGATYNSIALNMAVNENSNRRHTWIGYLALGTSATNTTATLQVTVTGTHTNVAVWAGAFSGVHQTASIGGTSSIYDNNTTASPQFPAASSVSAGGYGIYTWSASQVRNSDDEGYTEHGEVNAGVNTGVASLAFASGGSTQPTVTFQASTRGSLSLLTLEPAPAGSPAGITVNPTGGLTTTELGGTAQFTVVLDSAPASSVTIVLNSSDTTEGTVSPTSLTFTTGDWSSAQTVTITGVDDVLSDGNVAYTIVTDPASSADANYNGLNAADVSVTNTDNDPPPPHVPAGSAMVYVMLFGSIALYGLKLARKKAG